MPRDYSLWMGIAIVLALVAVSAFAVALRPQSNDSVTPTLSAGTVTPATSTSATPTTTPDNSPATISAKDQAAAAYTRGDYVTAIAQYKLTIAAETDAKAKAKLWNLLANSYRDNKNPAQAVTSYNEAIKLDPTFITPYINASNVRISQNRKDLARQILEQGLAANPANADLERELSILNLSGTGAAQ